VLDAGDLIRTDVYPSVGCEQSGRGAARFYRLPISTARVGSRSSAR